MYFIEQIFKDSPNPTYIKDSVGEIIWANAAYAALHRISLPQLLEAGKVDFDFALERDLEILSSDEVFKEEEFYKLEDGREAWFLTTKNAVEQKNGARYLLSTSVEITNLKETIQTAEDSFATKEKFLSDVSKGIEAPLLAIISLVRLLKQTFINKDQKRYLNSMLSITDYLLDVPKDILEYARVEAGVVDTSTEVVDIVSFIHGIIRFISPKAGEQGITLHFSEPLVKLPLIESNTVYLNLILVKIFGCAIRYTKSKDVNISVFQKERLNKTVYLQFSINNLGLGQNSEDLEKLFDSDNLFHNDASFKKGGGNLGIYTCKKLITLQGGKIWLDKKAGQETSIEIVLPFTINEKLIIEQNDNYVRPEQLSNLSLLLIEDNESSQTLVKHQIQNWNTKIDIASNGADGILLASQKQYDLILMDVEMPEMDGFQATTQIRETEGPNQHSPIVAFTTNPGNYDVATYKAAGFNDFLKKPYHTFDLYLCISKNTTQKIKEAPAPKKEIEMAKELLYDFSGLGSMADDGVFIRKMQKLFIDIVPGQLSKLTNAIQQHDWETVALIAHSLKSTYGNIKVVKAANAMKRVEEIANNKTDFSELDGLLKAIMDTTKEVIIVFSKELAI
jgi:two-component system aerobic respiration control sensor histidine kinase ArcB